VYFPQNGTDSALGGKVPSAPVQTKAQDQDYEYCLRRESGDSSNHFRMVAGKPVAGSTFTRISQNTADQIDQSFPNCLAGLGSCLGFRFLVT
jgi:hypothetical protein